MVWVALEPGEDFDRLLRRFSNRMQSAGILREYKYRRHFIGKPELRRKKRKSNERYRRLKQAARQQRSDT